MEKFLTSDPYQQFPNSPNYTNQDKDTKYYPDFEETSYDDEASNYDEYYYHDYSDYLDNILPYYDDERIPWNNRLPGELFNDRNDQRDQEETRYPEQTDNMEIKYSQSYSKMNLANKLSGDTEVPNIGPISNNVINSINQTEKFPKSKPVNVTPGPNTSCFDSE